jgi:hypothetical protein
MIKCFYVNGDSFSFGSELGLNSAWFEKTSFNEFTEYHRKNCYSGIIADQLKIEEYINNSLPGVSNERIYRCILSDIASLLEKYNPDEIFVTISLSSPLRREFWRSDLEQWLLYIVPHEPPKTDHVNYEFWKMFTKNFGSDVGFYNFDIMMILAIQNFLIKNKIPYLLTTSMNNTAEDVIRNKLIPKNILDQIYTFRCIINPSFMIFNRDTNSGVGPNHHPLEKGHQAWADYLLEYIKNNNLLTNQDLSCM